MPNGSNKLYADVILPLALREALTYKLPEELAAISQGCRVEVPLGNKKYTGIIKSVHSKKPAFKGLRMILRGETTPFVSKELMDFWHWMAEYYMCSAGEVMKAAIPSQLLHMPPVNETSEIRKPRKKRVLNHAENSPNEPEIKVLNELTKLQNEIFLGLQLKLAEKNVALLHGVTSSGKTEIYFHLISDHLRQGRQVLYLVPEIALTTQLTGRITRHFGSSALVYHSRLTDTRRSIAWEAVRGNEGTGATLILGARSSLFLPFSRLGLVIVDEEHDGSYKQQDPAPRYNARDAAIMLAGTHNAKVVLGSATPSVESYYNALTGKYGLAEIHERHGEVAMPAITIADTRRAVKRKEMVSHFAPELVSAIDEALNAGEQIILFRNRRGFAPFLRCNDCGWIPVCKSCSVSLTYHRGASKLRCHYCGYSAKLPSRCEACDSDELKTVGFGTEKIEEELKLVFPRAIIQRFDQDTTKGKNGHQKILDDFGTGKTDILVGTQMISKGLDFENLTVVGVLHADSLLNYPDFRSYERSFQMMEQVSGRSGRRKKVGKVIIQTADPNHPVIEMVLRHDYKAMYEAQLAERQMFGYPPFTRLVRIFLKHRDEITLNRLAASFASDLRGFFGNRVMGPEPPPVAKMQSLHIRSLLIKIEKNKSQVRAKQFIAEATERVFSMQGAGTLRVNIDVDPL
jgi:primosomal protein N' (replication factor Y)